MTDELIERWRPIMGFAYHYEISDYGNVRRLVGKKNHQWYKYLKLGDKQGYKNVYLYYGEKAKRKQCYVHKLVAQYFIDNPNDYKVVNHKDENPQNNYVDNLEWCSQKYNVNYGTANIRRIEKMGVKVYQCTLDGEILNSWNSLNDAAKNNDIALSSIRYAIAHSGISKGYKWVLDVNDVFWKDIEGYEGLYKISKNGQVYSCKYKRLLKIKHNHGDYDVVQLYRNAVCKTLLVHRLVALAFVENPLNKSCVDHIDTNKHNNNFDNLRWVTYKENTHNPLSFTKVKEHIEKIKMHNKGKKAKTETIVKLSKPVLQFTKDGVFVREWIGAHQVEREIGIDASGIINCCNHRPRYKTAGGFKWEYKSK